MPRRTRRRDCGQKHKGLLRPKRWHRQTDARRFLRAMCLWPKEVART